MVFISTMPLASVGHIARSHVVSSVCRSVTPSSYVSVMLSSSRSVGNPVLGDKAVKLEYEPVALQCQKLTRTPSRGSQVAMSRTPISIHNGTPG